MERPPYLFTFASPVTPPTASEVTTTYSDRPVWEPSYRTSTNGYAMLDNPALPPLSRRVVRWSGYAFAFVVGFLVGTYSLIAVAR